MPRELLKFRPGDCGLKICKDGTMEVAGVDESGGMIDQNGKVNPALLFAAAWARKEQKVFEALVQNFKDSVLEGYFGPAAQDDYKKALTKTNAVEKDYVAVKKETVPFNPEEPAVFGDAASGAVTLEQPQPLDVKGHLDRRDS